MAFAAEQGYGNLPNGNFSPEIFSKNAQIAFRKTSVSMDICNSDYFGEISEYGDTVRIIREPDVSIAPYKRGTNLQLQDLDDEEITLVIDKANYFNFAIDDLEKKQSHVDFESLAGDRAAYKLRDGMDSEILTYMTTQVPTAQIYGTASVPIVVGFGTGEVTPLAAMNRLKRWMAESNIPFEDRWFVADPVFYELLESEDSKLINHDYAEKGILRNGKIVEGMVRGFKLYGSNNLPTVGTGQEGSGAGNYGWILAGHKSSTACAEQINKVEKYRPHQTFSDAVKGLQYYGRKVLREDALFAIRYNLG